jgi:L-lactate utilization protein LutB
VHQPIKFTGEIDPKKTVENPGLIAFAHSVGGAVIKPEDAGKIKSKALTSMRQQTERSMHQLYKQMQLLAEQANEIKQRVEISERIYQIEMKFEPLVGHYYFLYEREDGTDFLSIIAPDEWGRSKKQVKAISKILLLADHTWEVCEI